MARNGVRDRPPARSWPVLIRNGRRWTEFAQRFQRLLSCSEIGFGFQCLDVDRV